jgi:hypothetical protein
MYLGGNVDHWIRRLACNDLGVVLKKEKETNEQEQQQHNNNNNNNNNTYLSISIRFPNDCI